LLTIDSRFLKVEVTTAWRRVLPKKLKPLR
jgi:hypothetical protein